VNGASAARLALLSCIWGASFLFIKEGLEGLAPMQIVLVRVVSGAAVLAAIVAVRRVALPRSRALWGHLAVLAVLANVVPFFLFAWAEQRIGSGMAGILNGATPLLTLAVAVAFLPEERATPVRVAGMVLGFAGVVLIVGPWRDDAGGGTLAGQLACVAAAACYGVTFVYTRRFVVSRGEPLLALAAGQLSAASLMLLVLAPFVARDPVDLTASVVASVLTLGVVGTGLAYLLYYALVHDEGATTASMVTYLIPIVAVVLGVVVRDEAVTWNTLAGAAVVIAGVALAEGRLGRGGPATVPEVDACVPLPVPAEDRD
jgi:drug/metabolite transporter (DMT)-like permease